jgi:hypothetical protein
MKNVIDLIKENILERVHVREHCKYMYIENITCIYISDPLSALSHDISCKEQKSETSENTGHE